MTLPALRKPVQRVAIATAALLLVPLVAGQLTQEVDWGAGDYLAAACLLFAAGATAVVGWHRLTRGPRRWAFVAVVGLVFAVAWAELAVGLLT